MYRENKIGPNIKLCCTPQEMGAELEEALSSLTEGDLLLEVIGNLLKGLSLKNQVNGLNVCVGGN